MTNPSSYNPKKDNGLTAAMRDTNQGMPELLDAYERDGQHFGAIEVRLDSDTRQFECWLGVKDYLALRQILQTRPFDRLNTMPYHHFVVDSVRRSPGSALVGLSIRIEQGKEGRQIEFKVPLSLASSLLFFARLRDFSEASHLHSPEPTS